MCELLRVRRRSGRVMNFTIQELKDIQSAVIFDTQGTHGDARSVRLEALYEKLKATIKEREGK
jgi:hypothetical protein